MAKGFAVYVIEEVRQMEEEFLEIALEKCSLSKSRNSDMSYNNENEQLFENITFKD